MSALASLQNGYINATKTIGTPREVEYQLLARITGRMSRAKGPDGDFNQLAAAVHDNLMFWQALALDVMQDDNALPDMLRAQIFYLYEFTRAHTAKIHKREAAVDALIDINSSIMSGLRAAQPEKGRRNARFDTQTPSS